MVNKNNIVIKYIFVFLVLIVSYLFLGVLTSLIPSNAIKENVIKTSEILQKDGDKKLYKLGYKAEIIFPFTDALMVNTAYSIDNSTPMKSFLLARKNYVPGKTKIENIDSQYDLSGNEKYVSDKNYVSTTKELYGLMHDELIEDSYEYARYWHGYLVILRPLLLICDLSAIRIIQIAIMAGVVVAMLILIYKKIDLSTTIFFILSLLAISIFVIANSINESLIFIFSFIAIIILLAKKEKIKDVSLFFFVIGSITNYIDLFTVPLVSFGLLATVWFLILQKEDKKHKIGDYIKEFLKIGLAWMMGYALTWLAKWTIVEIGLNRKIIEQAITQARYRTVSSEEWMKHSTIEIIVSIIRSNLLFLSENIIGLVIILSTIFIIEELIRKRKEKINFKENLKNSLPFIAIFLLPIIWYAVIKQHSGTHHFFTYRLLSISIINLFIIIKNMFRSEEIEKNLASNEKNKKVKK